MRPYPCLCSAYQGFHMYFVPQASWPIEIVLVFKQKKKMPYFVEALRVLKAHLNNMSILVIG